MANYITELIFKEMILFPIKYVHKVRKQEINNKYDSNSNNFIKMKIILLNGFKHNNTCSQNHIVIKQIQILLQVNSMVKQDNKFHQVQEHNFIKTKFHKEKLSKKKDLQLQDEGIKFKLIVKIIINKRIQVHQIQK